MFNKELTAGFGQKYPLFFNGIDFPAPHRKYPLRAGKNIPSVKYVREKPGFYGKQVNRA